MDAFDITATGLQRWIERTHSAGLRPIPAVLWPAGGADGRYHKAPNTPRWRAYMAPERRTDWPSDALERPYVSAAAQAVPLDVRYGVGLLLTAHERLVVIDIDSRTGASTFMASPLAHLAKDTYVERTPRGGLHILLRWPPSMPYPSGRKTAVAELLAGGFVCTAPTAGYDNLTPLVRADGSANVKELAAIDAAALLEWLGSPEIRDSGDFHAPQVPTTTQAPSGAEIAQNGPKTADYLRRLLRRNIQRAAGRNEGLFRTACQARDIGVSMSEFIAATEALYKSLPHADGSTAPDPGYRATVRSAYSRPPRRPAPPTSNGLPNRTRRKLRAAQLVHVSRFIDAAALAGCAGVPMTVREIAAAIGWSVRAVERVIELTSCSTLVFKHLGNAVVSAAPAISATASSDEPANRAPQESGTGSSTNCAPQEPHEPRRRGRGRPARRYIVSAAQSVGAGSGYSDAVPLEACRADGLYTEALYVALLKRLGSGQYSRRYLARCLGVSVETIKKLNKRLGIKRVPQYDILAPLTPAVWAELAAGDEHQRAGHLLVSPRADGSYRRHALSSAPALLKANRLAYLAAHAPAFYDVEGTFGGQAASN